MAAFEFDFVFTPPNAAEHSVGWWEDFEEVEWRHQNGLLQARDGRCGKWRSPYEISLWLDPDAGRIRPLCSGCRSQINSDPTTPSNDQTLMALQAHGVEVPEKLIRWTRVQCKIARHPGGYTERRIIDVNQKTGEIVVRTIEGGRTGPRSGIGIVD